MKQWNFKVIGIACGAVFWLTVARLSVSLGRLLYSLYTGDNVVGGEIMPTWQELVFEDAFFYIGLLALAGWIGCAIVTKKTR